MLDWLDWLIAVAVFWPMAMLFIGGAPRRLEGGGAVRQLGGLAITLVLFLVLWRVLVLALGAVMGPGHAQVFATVIAGLSTYPLAWLGFKLVGVRFGGAQDAAH